MNDPDTHGIVGATWADPTVVTPTYKLTRQYRTAVAQDRAGADCIPTIKEELMDAMFSTQRSSRRLKRRATLVLSTGVLGCACVLALTGSAGASAFPGANGKIVFTREITAGHQTALFTTDGSGAAPTQLTTPPASAVDDSARFSGDGTQVVFTRFDNNTLRTTIMIVPADGSAAPRAVYTQPSSATSPEAPSLSPDGSKVVFDLFSTSTFASAGIWEVNADGSSGTTPTQLTTGVDYRPTFSPDGTQVAFSEDNSSTTHTQLIKVVSAAGGTPTVIATLTAFADDTEWSPNGSTIVYDSGGSIFSTPSGGGGAGLLETPPSGSADTHPAFSPDGSTIVFGRFVPVVGGPPGSGSSSIYTLPASGVGTATQLVVPVAGRNDTHPDWAAIRTTVPDKTPPTITIASPQNGAHYALGSSLAFSYTCADSASGVATCTGDKPSGTALDTSRAGTFTLHVNAADKAGNTASSSVTYKIDASSSTAAAQAAANALNKAIKAKFAHLTVAKLLNGKGVSVSVTAKLAGKFSDKLLGSVGSNGQISSVKSTKSVILALGTRKVTKAGKVTIKITLTNLGRKLLQGAKRKHHAVHLRNTATFTPSGGQAAVHSTSFKLAA